MSTTETLLDLKVHKLSNESYAELIDPTTPSSIDNSALYLTPAPELVGANQISVTEDTENNKITFSVADGTTSQKGIVQLTNSLTSTSTTLAATAYAAKTLNDKINALDFTSPVTDTTETTIEAIDTVSQTNGQISATKKKITPASISTPGIVQLSSTASSTVENMAATPKGVQAAINALDVSEPDASGTSTTFIATAKQENGKIVVTKASLPEYLDTNVKLSEDVWTDKTIGYINGTATSPKKVASRNDSLKTMFTNIFGTVTDDTSNLVTNPYFSSVSIGSSSYEYGTKLSSVSVTVNPVSGDYKYGPPVSGAGWSGNYTLSGTGFTTKNNSTNNTQTVNLSSTFTVGTSSALTLTASRAYSAATNTAKSKMGATTTQKITAGTATKSGTFNPTAVKYVYYAVTSSTSTPSAWTKYGTGQTSVTGLTISANAGQYVWVATTDNCTSFYTFNQVSGEYNTDSTPTTKLSNQTITNSQSASTSGYYIYRITNAKALSGSVKYKLV